MAAYQIQIRLKVMKSWQTRVMISCDSDSFPLLLQWLLAAIMWLFSSSGKCVVLQMLLQCTGQVMQNYVAIWIRRLRTEQTPVFQSTLKCSQCQVNSSYSMLLGCPTATEWAGTLLGYSKETSGLLASSIGSSGHCLELLLLHWIGLAP